MTRPVSGSQHPTKMEYGHQPELNTRNYSKGYRVKHASSTVAIHRAQYPATNMFPAPGRKRRAGRPACEPGRFNLSEEAGVAVVVEQAEHAVVERHVTVPDRAGKIVHAIAIEVYLMELRRPTAPMNGIGVS
jgi:hypothetical protein